jgi:uncharacterized protein with HEPN domain
MKSNTAPLLIDFLKHIQIELDFIYRSTRTINVDDFLNDEMRIRAVIRSFEIIGEACKNIPVEFRQKYPAFDWRGFAGIRDRLIHRYWNVDETILWEAISVDVPTNKKWLDQLIENEINSVQQP